MGELRAEAPVARSQCGFPGCSKRDDQVRMQLIPNDFLGTVFPGAKHFHRKRAECVRHFFGGEKGKPGRKRQAVQEASRIPVGAIVRDEPCPPIIENIQEVWACR